VSPFIMPPSAVGVVAGKRKEKKLEAQFKKEGNK
jgi:hypothetical protein